MVNNALDQYASGTRKAEKSKVVKSIIDTIQKNCRSTGGGFIRQVRLQIQRTVEAVTFFLPSFYYGSYGCTIGLSKLLFLLSVANTIQEEISGQWYQISDKVAREKTGQALRDGIRTREVAREKAAQHHYKSNESGVATTSDVASTTRGANPLIDEARYPPGQSSSLLSSTLQRNIRLQPEQPFVGTKQVGEIHALSDSIGEGPSSPEAKRARLLESGRGFISAPAPASFGLHRQGHHEAAANNGNSSSDMDTFEGTGKLLASAGFSPSVSSSIFDSSPEDQDVDFRLPRAALDNDPVVLPRSAEPNIFPPYRSNLPLSFDDAVGSINTHQGIGIATHGLFSDESGHHSITSGSFQESKSAAIQAGIDDRLWGHSLNRLVHGSNLAYQHGGSARINVSAADRIAALPERVVERGFRQPYFFGQEEAKSSRQQHSEELGLGDFFDPRAHPNYGSNKKRSPELKGEPGSRKR